MYRLKEITMGVINELTDIKEDISDGVVANKVSRFAYTEQAYTDNDVDGVSVYDVNQEQNIPVGTAGVMKVNQTVIEKGWRARASSITRMLMNHFLGRVSYNLNKANDMINSILSNLISYLGTADGIATLDASGKLPSAQIPALGQQLPVTRKFLSSLYAETLLTRQIRSYTVGASGSGVRRDIAYHGGVWVICGKSTSSSTLCFWWSEDLLDWTQGTTSETVSTTLDCSNIYFYAGVFVASTNAGIWWSTNGKIWYLSETTDMTTYKEIIVEVGGKYYTNASVDGSRKVIYSEDCKTWTAITGATGVQFNLTSMKLLNDKYVVGTQSQAGGIWYSEDGITWEQGTGGTDKYLVPFIYAKSKYIAGSTNAGMWVSDDCASWTQLTGLPDSGDSKTVDSIGLTSGGAILARIGTSTLAYTSNFTSWTTVSSITASTISEIKYAKGIYIVATDNGCYWSTTGTGWIQVPVTLTDISSVYAPRLVNGVWFIFASSNYSYISKDGQNWVRTPSSFTLSSSQGLIKYLNGYWFSINTNMYSTSVSLEDLIEEGTIGINNAVLIND